MPQPILFFAFANDKESNTGFLRNLSKEEKYIHNALKEAEKEGICEVISKHAVTIDEIFEIFQAKENKGRIAIFHFGGHANSYRLLLENIDQSKSPAHKEGLMAFLGRQQGLELVFLNGCNTAQQAEALKEAGVPMVIGTVREVADTVACELAMQFYKSLGQGNAIKTAWLAAQDYIKTKKGGDHRGLYRKNRTGSLLPWLMKTKAGAENVKDWNLPDAAENPLFGLPPIPEKYVLPNAPYRFLGRYEREDARVFFGRGRKIRELYFRVTDGHSEPVILFHGQSGVGKSSLLEAGLMPRLEETHQIQYLRREPEIGLFKALKIALFQIEKENPASEFETDRANILEYWNNLEKLTGQPLLIILDQTEGVYNRQNSEYPQELNEFLEVVQNIFGQLATRPKGKLILSYRKEFHTDFLKDIKAFRIPFESFSLSRFDKRDIVEVVEGLESDESLKRKYQLRIEPHLANLMADELLGDKASPIAPILQIILTKMWKNQEEGLEKGFTIAAYQKLKGEGILLQDFYEQQIANVRQWDMQNGYDTVNSGLALDILNFHTTNWQFAESRTLQHLREQYEHRKDILPALLEQFDICYLLAFLSKEKTTLAHDTLAPVIQQNMKISDLPGQKAKRILEAKMLHTNQDDQTIIEPADLKLVEDGKNGMRIWTLEEQHLIKRSQVYREELEKERQKNEAYRQKSEKFRKRMYQWVAILSLLTGISFATFWWFADKNAQVSSLIAQAQSEEKTDPTIAFQTIQKALVIDPDNENAIQTQHDIYSDNEFYDTSLIFDRTVNALKTGSIFAAIGNRVYLMKKDGSAVWEKIQDEEILTVDVSANEELFLFAGKESTLKIADKDGDILYRFSEHSDWIRSAIFLPDGKRVLSGDRAGNIFLWNIKNDSLQKFEGHTDEIWDLAYSPITNQFVSASWDGTAKLWSLEDSFIADLSIEGRGLAVDISPDGSQIIVGDRTGRIYFYDNSGVLLNKFIAHEKRTNVLQFSPDGKMLLSAGDDKIIKLWDTAGNLLNSYKGHQDFVHSLDFTKDGRGFISGSEDQTIKIWRLESKVTAIFGEHENEVSDLALSEDGSLLVSGSGSGKQAEMTQINDLNNDFNFDDLLNPTSNPQNAYLWHLNENRPPDTLAGHQDGITAVAISQKANLILTGSEDQTASFWDLEGNALPTIIEHQASVQDVALSKNGEWFATSSYDSTLILGRCTTLLKDTLHLRFNNAIEKIAFSPTQDYLLVGFAGTKVSLIDFKGNEIQTFTQNKAGITAVAYAPDGQSVLIGDADGEAILYSVEGEVLWRFGSGEKDSSGAGGVRCLGFSGDGELVGIKGMNSKIKIFKINKNKVLQIITQSKNEDYFFVFYESKFYRYLDVKNADLYKYGIFLFD